MSADIFFYEAPLERLGFNTTARILRLDAGIIERERASLGM
jgi:hypothetical protein